MRPPRFNTRAGFVREALRLSWESDAFLAVVAYRLRTFLRQRGVPLVPELLHRFSVGWADVDIGDEAVVDPGLYLPHGMVTIRGPAHIGRGVIIAPWVKVEAGPGGADIDALAFLGTGSTVRGDVRIGLRSVVGANAVVEQDVEPFTTVGGVPARVIADRRNEPEAVKLAADAAARRGQKPPGV